MFFLLPAATKEEQRDFGQGFARLARNPSKKKEGGAIRESHSPTKSCEGAACYAGRTPFLLILENQA